MIAPPWGYVMERGKVRCAGCVLWPDEGHETGCKTPVMESTVEAMARALEESQNALLDYVDRLERQGSTMGYGRSVLAQVAAALASWRGLTQKEPSWHYCAACRKAHVGYITSACEQEGKRG